MTIEENMKKSLLTAFMGGRLHDSMVKKPLKDRDPLNFKVIK